MSRLTQLLGGEFPAAMTIGARDYHIAARLATDRVTLDRVCAQRRCCISETFGDFTDMYMLQTYQGFKRLPDVKTRCR